MCNVGARHVELKQGGEWEPLSDAPRGRHAGLTSWQPRVPRRTKGSLQSTLRRGRRGLAIGQGPPGQLAPGLRLANAELAAAAEGEAPPQTLPARLRIGEAQREVVAQVREGELLPLRDPGASRKRVRGILNAAACSHWPGEAKSHNLARPHLVTARSCATATPSSPACPDHRHAQLG